MRAELPRVYLLDVEGTVAPVSLVSEQLFPYARKRFADFLVRSRGNESVRADLMLLAQENQDEANRAETGNGVPPLPPVDEPAQVETPRFRLDAVFYITWLMDRDRKSTALKSLQGKIWKAGFESGELVGTLFADVPDALRQWAAQARVAIYSSGSVEAQQLVFRHSNYGDLTPLLSGYFDTRIGAKAASASYAAIAAELAVAPEEILFFSDVIRELDPAREAGLQTRLVIREGNAPVDDPHDHTVIHSFDREPDNETAARPDSSNQQAPISDPQNGNPRT
jgi:2,3-diketo-5-methylthio-1-phosphopentane phosphatase